MHQVGSDHDANQPNAARLKDLLAEALDLPEADRHAFLANACGDDRALFNEAESLLRAAQASGFLKSPTASFVADLPPSESAGGKIGPYKLLQQIGEGGFGAVFMAEQTEPIRRRVALKIIKLGMDTKQVVARFEQERQALAVMDHPNIAKVFDAGATESGRPYFVMELVKGQPITEYCDRQGLSIPERLELFSQVCHAVQHAHTKGVIHRDIKPRNVLVSTHEGKPLVKVIDFGIAKATDQRMTEKTLFTEHQAMIGTPEYMSPEQAEGSLDIDTRTDVYSLGVLLYELLTGATPFDGKSLREAGYGEICRIIREVDPPRPSLRVSTKAQAAWASGAPSSAKSSTPQQIASVRRTEPNQLFGILKGDLDWVVMKALEKDRTRRYATPTTLAEDVARYLAGEAVTAVPPSRWYRVRKFVRRNRLGVVAGVVVAGTLGIGVLVGWQLLSARRASEFRAIESEAARSRAATELQVEAHARSIAEALTAVLSDKPADADKSLARSSESLRHFEWSVTQAMASEAPRAVSLDAWPQSIFSSDGTCYLMLEGDELVAISVPNLSVLRRFALPQGWRTKHVATWTIRISADGERLHFAARDFIRSWEFRTAAIVSTCRLATPDVIVQDVSSDGRWAWARGEGSAHLLLLAGEQVHPVWETSDAVAMEFSPDSTRMVTLHANGRLRLWRLDSQTGLDLEPTEVDLANGTDLRAVRLTDRHVAVFGVDETASGRVLAVADGRELSDSRFAQLVGVDGSTFIVVRHPGDTHLSEYHADTETWTRAGAVRPSGSVKPTADPAIAVVRSGEDSPLGWSRVTGRWAELPTTWAKSGVGCGHSPDFTLLAVVPADEEQLRFVSARPSVGFSASSVADDRHQVQALNISRGSKTAVILTLHPDALLTFDPMRIDRFPVSGVISNVLLGAASADGERLVAINQDSLQIIDADGLHERLRVDHPGATTRAVALSATGELLAILDASGELSLRSALDNTVLARGSVSAEFASASPRCAIGSDGSIAVANGRGDIVVFARSNDQLTERTRTSVSGGAVTAIVGVPARKEFLVGMKDGSTHVVDGASLAVRVTLPTNGHAVGAMTPSFDGLRYFTASDDGSIRIWHSETGKELLTLNEERITAAPTAIFIEPNNERLVVGYANGAERIWDAVTWAERVRRRGKPEWPNTEPKLVPVGAQADAPDNR